MLVDNLVENLWISCRQLFFEKLSTIPSTDSPQVFHKVIHKVLLFFSFNIKTLQPYPQGQNDTTTTTIL